MFSRVVRIQLIAFAVVTVVTLLYVAVNYVRIPQMLGFERYPLTLSLPEAAGLYPSARVTYRGVDVGQVQRLDLADRGIDVELRIDDHVDIPADVVAEVQSVSAIGEQYVNLVPQSEAGPYLAAGGVIPADRAKLPVGTSQLLDSANALIDSVPRDSLATSVDEFYQAFNGVGDDLGRLIDASTAFLGEADANLGPTLQLVHDLERVLGTQQDIGPAVRSWAADMAAFTGQLADSDPQLRGIVEQGQGTAQQIDGLFDDLRPTLPVLLADLATAGRVTTAYLPGIEHILTVLPANIVQMQSIAPEDRLDDEHLEGNIDFKLTSANAPPVCTDGFTDANRHRHSSDVAPAPLPTGHCKVPHDDPRVVRGARNFPCPDNPNRRAATAVECGLIFDRVGVPGAPAQPESVTANYDPGTGRVMTPGGDFFRLADLARNSADPRTWQDLLLATVQP